MCPDSLMLSTNWETFNLSIKGRYGNLKQGVEEGPACFWGKPLGQKGQNSDGKRSKQERGFDTQSGCGRNSVRAATQKYQTRKGLREQSFPGEVLSDWYMLGFDYPSQDPCTGAGREILTGLQRYNGRKWLTSVKLQERKHIYVSKLLRKTPSLSQTRNSTDVRFF